MNQLNGWGNQSGLNCTGWYHIDRGAAGWKCWHGSVQEVFPGPRNGRQPRCLVQQYPSNPYTFNRYQDHLDLPSHRPGGPDTSSRLLSASVLAEIHGRGFTLNVGWRKCSKYQAEALASSLKPQCRSLTSRQRCSTASSTSCAKNQRRQGIVASSLNRGFPVPESAFSPTSISRPRKTWNRGRRHFQTLQLSCPFHRNSVNSLPPRRHNYRFRSRRLDQRVLSRRTIASEDSKNARRRHPRPTSRNFRPT